jgi:hypothetical protein
MNYNINGVGAAQSLSKSVKARQAKAPALLAMALHCFSLLPLMSGWIRSQKIKVAQGGSS